MKVPLRYQVATYDCGPTTLLNAFSYLYEDKEIPAIIVQAVLRYTLDGFDSKGNIGEGGTSRYAMKLFSAWLKEYAKTNSFPVEVYYLEGEEVTFERLFEFLNKKSTAVIRCYQTSEHYVLVTGICDQYFYIFDPYYIDENFVNSDEMVRFDWRHPFSYNRVVDKERLFSSTKEDFSLGPILGRECILFMR